MRKLLALVLGIVLLLFTYYSTLSEVVVKRKTPKIGISFDSIVIERWSRDLEILTSTAKQFDYEVFIKIANEDLDTQIEQVNQMIDDDVDVLIILPKESDKFYEVVEKAKKEGIYVISYDRLITDAPIDLYISFDSFNTGEKMAERLFMEFDTSIYSEEKNIVIINGDPLDNNAVLVNEGIYSMIDSDYRVNIINEVWSPGWRESYARDVINDVLSSGDEIDGIIAANDTLAQAAFEELAARGLAEDVLIVSQDADLSACQRIVEGTQLATIYKPINSLAKSAIIASNTLLNTGEYATTDILVTEDYEIPFEAINVQIVDQDSMERVIFNSGFHKEEDVYRNVNN
jgi:D-xylose transport system substrate-binding protein